MGGAIALIQNGALCAIESGHGGMEREKNRNLTAMVAPWDVPPLY